LAGVSFFKFGGAKMSSARNWYSNPTQVYWTCQALLSGRVISHRTEIREVQGWRLGAIIHRLRRQYDWPINTEYRGLDNVAHYSLSKDCDRQKLRFPPSATMIENGEAA
jgi:hypothetical protein